MDRSTLWATAEALQVSGLGKVVDGLAVEKLFPEGYLAPAHLCTTVNFPNAKVADFRRIPILKAAVEFRCADQHGRGEEPSGHEVHHVP